MPSLNCYLLAVLVARGETGLLGSVRTLRLLVDGTACDLDPRSDLGEDYVVGLACGVVARVAEDLE